MANLDDVDFDLYNLRAEEDLWNRMIRTNNNLFNNSQAQGYPIDGDALLAQAENTKLTQSVLDMYNQVDRSNVS